jgi:GNAT superfamily N-acetyltransferase
MEVTNLTEGDLESLAGLYRQFWNEESSLERMRVTFRRLQENPNYILLGAKHEGLLVGTAMGIVCEELYGDCRPFLVIEDVVVDERHRRSGIGASLMRELEKRAVDLDCSYIIFVTEMERTDAHRFYESLGYKSDAYKGFKKRLTRKPPLT